MTFDQAGQHQLTFQVDLFLSFQLSSFFVGTYESDLTIGNTNSFYYTFFVIHGVDDTIVKQ